MFKNFLRSEAFCRACPIYLLHRETSSESHSQHSPTLLIITQYLHLYSLQFYLEAQVLPILLVFPHLYSLNVVRKSLVVLCNPSAQILIEK